MFPPFDGIRSINKRFNTSPWWQGKPKASDAVICTLPRAPAAFLTKTAEGNHWIGWTRNLCQTRRVRSHPHYRHERHAKARSRYGSSYFHQVASTTLAHTTRDLGRPAGSGTSSFGIFVFTAGSRIFSFAIADVLCVCHVCFRLCPTTGILYLCW